MHGANTTLSPEDLELLPYLTAEERRELDELLLQDARYSPHIASPRQSLFLDLDCLEAFYGGAAGGGKSDALLMAALQNVHVPKYAALLLRRTFADLTLPESLIPRSHEWLQGTGAKWHEKETGRIPARTWSFPSGATLTFGYLADENDKYRYQSSAYQFIGFDELTQFTDTQYLYLFSRLRRLEGSDVPLRMRSASNPGGLGAEWVKQRFIPEDFLPQDSEEEKVWYVEEKNDADEVIAKRAFVPARLKDNAHLDYEAYLGSLMRLDKVTRQQLLEGDWSITATGRQRFDVEAISKFEPRRGEEGLVIMNVDLQNRQSFHWRPQVGGPLAMWYKPERGQRYVMGVDTARGKDVNKGEGSAKGDFSVIQVRNVHGTQVARYRARLSERGFAKDVYAVGRYYNNAYIVPEVTGGYGRAMLDHLVLDLEYPMEFIYRAMQGAGNSPSASPSIDKLGWSTSTVTRPQMESALDTAILEHSIETFDPQTIAEYLSYEYDKAGKAQGRQGTHDDCVMADALAVIGLRMMPSRLRLVDSRREPVRYHIPLREQLKQSFR